MMLSRSCQLAAAAALLSLAVIPLAGSSQQSPAAWLVAQRIDCQGPRSDDRSDGAINAIFETTMPELRQDREELERLEAKLSRMIQDERMDEASLARQIDRVETARANGNKTRSLMLTRMYRVLTREQRTRFDQISKQWAAPAGGRSTRAGVSRRRPSREITSNSRRQLLRPLPHPTHNAVPDSGRRSHRGTAMKQCQLIGCAAVLVALVSSPSPASAQISEERIRELVREAAKTAEQTGPSPVQVPGRRADGSPDLGRRGEASRSSGTSISPCSG